MILPTKNTPYCTLCPGFCRLGLGYSAPDKPAVDYPLQNEGGLCPRGSALGELLASPARIRWPRKRNSGAGNGSPALVDLSLSEGIAAAAAKMADGAVVLFDGNVSIEEMAVLAQVGKAWPALGLCPVVLPEDEQTLLGLEAAGATYLSDRDLAECDGFIIVGDAFAANPRIARYVMDAVKAAKRAAMVTIDSGAGVTGTFGTMQISCPAGGELAAFQNPKVAAAVAATTKLGIVIAPQTARGPFWRWLGFLAGKLAQAHGGGVAVATTGANALAAVRARKHFGWMSLAAALSPENKLPRLAIGTDVLGMLGGTGGPIALAAASVPNETTAAAEIVLPVALGCESGGTYLQAGRHPVKTVALMAPPAGVPTAAALMTMLARARGIALPAAAEPAVHLHLDRISVSEPDELAVEAIDCKHLVLTSLAMHQADGSLTACATWQRNTRPAAELRVGPADAAEMGLSSMDKVVVSSESGQAPAVVRLMKNIAPGTLSITCGYPAVRRLAPYTIDAKHDTLISRPATAKVEK